MLSTGLIVTIGLGYLLFLFLLAFIAERWSKRGGAWLIQSPVIYTLSLAIYCTSWTFYGAVGSAARNGLEYLTIYLGPTFVLMAWWFLVRKMVRISKGQRITSIADFISSRYGKSSAISAIVTVITVIGITPYIGLQLKAVAASFDALTLDQSWQPVSFHSTPIFSDTGFWVALIMAAFVILFGTRRLGADEHHPGIVAAIAFESVVKFVSLGLVAIFALYGMNDGFQTMFMDAQWNEAARRLYEFPEGFEARWITTFFLAGAAFLCLPRQFQVMVVENSDEKHLATASWLFPLYLMLVSLFVIPIAISGLTQLPESANPDLYVLSLPLSTGNSSLALIAFIGGLSAATSMVIVSSIALSIMISNHLITPILLRLPQFSEDDAKDYSGTLFFIRRTSILVIIGMAFAYYYWIAARNPLASIGLISFAGVAQFLPALIGGIFWAGATKHGAMAGLIGGFMLWAYTLIIPGFAGSGWAFGDLMIYGPFNITLLKPLTLFGFQGWDPLVHGLFWSLSVNIFLYVIISLLSEQSTLERIQAVLFVDVFKKRQQALEHEFDRSASIEDLLRLTQRILGSKRAEALFHSYRDALGNQGCPEQPDARFIAYIEKELASNLGAASARTLISRVAKGEQISLDAVIHILDETQAVIRYSQALENKSQELEETATQLRAANEQLRRLDHMKDDFLSRVSHELRTPMTSIRSFSEILVEDREVPPEQSKRFLTIIQRESIRLTSLLDEILDLAQLEDGDQNWQLSPVSLSMMAQEAVQTMQGLARQKQVALLDQTSHADLTVNVHPDRLKQVMINVISNAIKYNTNSDPTVTVTTTQSTDYVFVKIMDNGPGISKEDQRTLFLKFSRGWNSKKGTRDGAGLGLAISKRIMKLLDGDLYLSPETEIGSCFVLKLPKYNK